MNKKVMLMLMSDVNIEVEKNYAHMGYIQNIYAGSICSLSTGSFMGCGIF